jgi:hypothetical protein
MLHSKSNILYKVNGVKVAIQCDSPLLQRSLELFLDGNLTSLRQCDLLIRDKDIHDDQYPTFVIGSDTSTDLIKPFSKAQLLHALNQKFESDKHAPSPSIEEPFSSVEEGVSFEILERHIDKLTREYQSNILKAIRAFYEK